MTATHGESITTGWVPDDSTFGARLAMIRFQKGWGGAVVAGDRTNVRPETWRAWENGTNKNPRNYEEIVAKIARKSGCDAGWLYGGRELTGAIDLDRLEDGLNRGLPGAVAVALAFTREIDPSMLGSTGRRTNRQPAEGSDLTPGYVDLTDSTIPKRTEGTTRPPNRQPAGGSDLTLGYVEATNRRTTGDTSSPFAQSEVTDRPPAGRPKNYPGSAKSGSSGPSPVRPARTARGRSL